MPLTNNRRHVELILSTVFHKCDDESPRCPKWAGDPTCFLVPLALPFALPLSQYRPKHFVRTAKVSPSMRLTTSATVFSASAVGTACFDVPTPVSSDSDALSAAATR